MPNQNYRQNHNQRQNQIQNPQSRNYTTRQHSYYPSDSTNAPRNNQQQQYRQQFHNRLYQNRYQHPGRYFSDGKPTQRNDQNQAQLRADCESDFDFEKANEQFSNELGTIDEKLGDVSISGKILNLFEYMKNDMALSTSF